MTDTQLETQDVAALWLATQQAIASRTAHEIKNTLNGVAVNLEVVRSRLGRAPATAASATFAETASQQFEVLTRQTEALLALVRPVRLPADVAQLTAQIAALLEAAAERDGARLIVDASEGGAATMVDGAVVRLAVASALLAAIEAVAPSRAVAAGAGHAAIEVHCQVTVDEKGPRLTVRKGGDAKVALPAEVARVAADAGVRVAVEGGLTLSFPPTPRGDDLTPGS